MYYNKS